MNVYSIKFRVWHWLNALIISALVLTVWLRESFLSYKTNAPLLLSRLSEMGVTITQEQSVTLAKALRAELWQVHIYLGYALIAMILFRGFLIFKDNSEKVSFMKKSFHKKVVTLSYLLFFVALFVISASGIALTFHETFAIDEEKLHDIKEVHETLYLLIVGFIGLHIAGLVMAENRGEAGIISTMVHGKIKSKTETPSI
jgi:cytochrome b561